MTHKLNSIFQKNVLIQHGANMVLLEYFIDTFKVDKNIWDIVCLNKNIVDGRFCSRVEDYTFNQNSGIISTNNFAIYFPKNYTYPA